MSYKNLADNTRVWIYQSNRPLSEQEVKSIQEQGDDFIRRWSAHGAKLNASFEIFHNLFIALFVDEEQAKATGCSIDKSVRLIKSFEKEFDLSLLDRTRIAYRDGNIIRICTSEELVGKMRERIINENTIVFNNLVSTKKEFQALWETPLKESWHFELIK